uniref:Unkempt family like zinc finger n=1 Tax=Cricetulus griseus TaxID=10029 RepID=A0A8C2QHL9_CRIGR
PRTPTSLCSALDLHLSDINIASLDKDLDEQDLGLTGLNGVPGSIWDFVSGSFSPSPSPILNSGPSASSSASPNSAELARVRRQLDEAKRKIRQWEESWQQVKQVIFQLRAKQCVACQERAHGTVLRPCQHRVLCELCAASTPECPYCKGQPLPW